MSVTLELDAAVGVSGAVEVVALGQVTRSSALISALGPFELGSDAASEVTLHEGTGFESDEVGVVPRASSLAQGQVISATHDGEWFGAEFVGRLIEHPVNGDYLFCPQFSALVSAAQTTDLEVHVFTQFMRPLLLIDQSIEEFGGDEASIVADGVYTGVTNDSPVVLETESGLSLAHVTVVKVEPTDVGNISLPTTVVSIQGDFGLLQDKKQSLKIWFNPVPAARLVRLPATQVTYDQILAVTNPPPDAIILDSTDAVITPDSAPAIPPIRILRNLAKATRGKTVRDEIIGSGNASLAFQSFLLAKSPLTYLADPKAPNGRRAQIEVYVDGQKWRHAPSFYGARPDDAIYIIRHDEEHQTFIVFGDGELGRRLPTGVDNVVATYRYGVGGNVPANSITTLEKPIKGVRKIFNPLPATGGKEPPTREQMRREAPLATLVLDRCVSLLDFEAAARRFGNVINAKVRWNAGKSKDATLKIWISTRDAGDPSNALHVYLAAMSDPGLLLSVSKAKADTRVLRIELAIDPRYRTEEVELDAARKLFHDYDGLLSTRNAAIGGTLARSQLHAAIHAIPGVLGIDAITLDGIEMPNILTMPPDTYLDLEHPDMTVGSIAAGLQLFGSP